MFQHCNKIPGRYGRKDVFLAHGFRAVSFYCVRIMAEVAPSVWVEVCGRTINTSAEQEAGQEKETCINFERSASADLIPPNWTTPSPKESTAFRIVPQVGPQYLKHYLFELLFNDISFILKPLALLVKQMLRWQFIFYL